MSGSEENFLKLQNNNPLNNKSKIYFRYILKHIYIPQKVNINTLKIRKNYKSHLKFNLNIYRLVFQFILYQKPFKNYIKNSSYKIVIHKTYLIYMTTQSLL